MGGIAGMQGGRSCGGIKAGLFLVSKGLQCATESLNATGLVGSAVQATPPRIRGKAL